MTILAEAQRAGKTVVLAIPPGNSESIRLSEFFEKDLKQFVKNEITLRFFVIFVPLSMIGFWIWSWFNFDLFNTENSGKFIAGTLAFALIISIVLGAAILAVLLAALVEGDFSQPSRKSGSLFSRDTAIDELHYTNKIKTLSLDTLLFNWKNQPFKNSGSREQLISEYVQSLSKDETQKLLQDSLEAIEQETAIRELSQLVSNSGGSSALKEDAKKKLLELHKSQEKFTHQAQRNVALAVNGSVDNKLLNILASWNNLNAQSFRSSFSLSGDDGQSDFEEVSRMSWQVPKSSGIVELSEQDNRTIDWMRTMVENLILMAEGAVQFVTNAVIYGGGTVAGGGGLYLLYKAGMWLVRLWAKPALLSF